MKKASSLIIYFFKGVRRTCAADQFCHQHDVIPVGPQHRLWEAL